MRKSIIFIGLAVFAHCSLVTPRSRGQLIEGLVNVRFQLDPSVFAVMAAINAGGFDLDADALDSNPVRKLVRNHLSRLDPDLVASLRNFYFAHDVELDAIKQQSKYLSFALALKGPPEFALAVKSGDLPQDAQGIVGFERLVRETWEKGGLASVWETVRQAYVREAEGYRPLIRRTILQCLRYLRMDARVAFDRQVIITPELLNGYGIVNARNIGENYHLLIGPSRQTPRPMGAFRHEYLHFLIDPLIAKYAGDLPEPEGFLRLVQQRSGVLAHLQKDFPLVATESLISVIEIRLESALPDERLSQIITRYEQGLILTPYFNSAFEQFEGRENSFYESVSAMIKGIQLEPEMKRPEAIALLQKEIDSRRAAARAKEKAEADAGAEVRILLVRANEHLLASRWEDARGILNDVLKRDPGNASALYGLAQIAGRDQDLERALDLYAKAAARPGVEQWIAGWALVRRGNIYRFLGDAVSARKEWLKVLELEGDLRGAKEAASKALSEK